MKAKLLGLFIALFSFSQELFAQGCSQCKLLAEQNAGLDENSLTRVFDRFWRADPSRARVRGGTGLGLSIALEDARLHNGELEAWGRPGRGAHFVVTLPRNTWESIDQRLIPLQPEDYKA